MVRRKVLISGAGIAGPTLGFWLARHGFAATVVETSPEPRPGGQAVDLRGAGRTVVERMGLLSAVRDVRVDERGLANVDARGRRRSSMPADAFGGEGIVAEIEVARGDLARVLYDATRSAVEYRFADRIVALTQDATGVAVRFASGADERFDLVVGADGVYSAVRELAFGPHERFVQPLGGYTSYFTVPDPGDLDGWLLMYNAPGGRVATIRPARDGTAQASLAFRSARLRYDRQDRRAQEQLLRSTFAGVGWRVPTLLSAMADASDFYFDAFCQVHLDSWTAGRVALIGDAAYCSSPLSGLGTSLAMVGAYVLAGELAASEGEPGPAFARYHTVMRDYVRQCQQLPPGGIKGYAPNSSLMIRMRDLSMNMMTRWPMRPMIAAQFTKADSIDLPDYPVRRPVS
jgi:2-polyprenyl-6-methoxyphenol hydroxylase-like FAD-dependent oxidoreductase